MKKMRKTLCSLLTCLFVILAVPTAVSAAAKAPVCPKTQTLQYYKAYMNGREQRMGGYGYIYIKNLSKSATITNVKSSNKKYTAQREEGLNAIYVQCKEQGFGATSYDVKDGDTTQLTFTVKQNGKSYKMSCKVTFKAHEPVFKTFKLGSKDFTSLAVGHYIATYKDGVQRKGKVKVQIEAAKNYKIDSIQILYKNGEKYTTKKVKNGTKVSLKNAVNINVDYHTTVKTKYYKKPVSEYRTYFFGGTVKTPLHESFSLIF